MTRQAPDGRIVSLAAYVELKPGVTGLLSRHLQSMLAQRLPAHMIPADIVVIDALPWLPNFKIDRQGLKDLDAARTARAESPAADPVTAEIIKAFESVLKVKGASADDDLMSLGGDSLQAVTVALEIEQRLGVAVSPEDIGMSCAIGEIAGRLGLAGRIAQPAASA